MSRLACFLFLILIAATSAAESQWSLSATEWAQPRHGEWLVSHPALAAAVDAMQRDASSVLQLRYPGGDEGVLWVEELQAWLVALGVESQRIESTPGSEAADRIEISVITP